MYISAIILAAGASARMGRDKTTAELNGLPVFMHSVNAFSKSAADEIILVVQSGKEQLFADILSGYDTDKPIKIISGGSERFLSAINAVKATDGRCDIIAVHDAARPLISAEVIERVFAAAAEYGAAIAAIPATDTVKVCGGDVIEDTPDRQRLWLAQTPQAFYKSEYLAAFGEISDFSAITDDAGLFEKTGRQVRIVQGDKSNIKLTQPADFALAQAIIGYNGDKAGTGRC